MRPLPIWTFPVLMIGGFWSGAIAQGQINTLGLWLVHSLAVVGTVAIVILRRRNRGTRR